MNCSSSRQRIRPTQTLSSKLENMNDTMQKYTFTMKWETTVTVEDDSYENAMLNAIDKGAGEVMLGSCAFHITQVEED